MGKKNANSPDMAPEEYEIFRRWLEILNQAGIPYVMAGAFAVYLHTGVWRDTKDMDVFLQARDLKKVLDAFSAAGYKTRVQSRHWLAKIRQGPYLLDLIFGFWNGRMKIGEDWFARSRPVQFAGLTVPLIALEDLIASKLYVASRDRFDGADISHLIRKAGGKLDWGRVLSLIGEDYPLLLWHLIHFQFVYPGQAGNVRDLTRKLFQAFEDDWPGEEPSSFFRGPLLDPISYIPEIERGRPDPREMTPVVDRKGNLL